MIVLGGDQRLPHLIGNFNEFSLFTALRQSEEIGLRTTNCGLGN